MKFAIGVVILVSLGCSGDNLTSPASAVCEPLGTTTGQLDTAASGSLVVSPDEKHVAYLRNLHTMDAGCVARGDSKTLGTLVVLDLGSDSPACARVVADNVDAISIYFSADSQNLVFMNDVNGCGVGKLKIANADGTNVRLVHGAASDDVAVGLSVFFIAPGEDRYLAAPMSGGKTVSIGKESALNQGQASPNAAGTAFAYTSYRTSDQGTGEISLTLVTLPSGASHTIVNGASNQSSDYAWSPRGDWLAFCYGPHGMTPVSLAIVAADGSHRTDISPSSACYSLTFSPDSAWLAYTEPDGSDGARLMIYSLSGKRSIVLGALPPGYVSISFSDDGTNVIAVVSPLNWGKRSVYAARTNAADSLKFLLDFYGTPDAVVSAGGYVAVQVDLEKVEVYAVSGGTPVTLAGREPQFEPGVPQPRLLLWQAPQSLPNGLVIAASDGSAATTRTVPDFVSFAAWLGSIAIYGSVPTGGQPTSISALTSAGASTLLADGVGAYAWAPTAAPTRLFYSRAAETTGGPVGVFSVDLPR